MFWFPFLGLFLTFEKKNVMQMYPAVITYTFPMEQWAACWLLVTKNEMLVSNAIVSVTILGPAA